MVAPSDQGVTDVSHRSTVSAALTRSTYGCPGMTKNVRTKRDEIKIRLRESCAKHGNVARSARELRRDIVINDGECRMRAA
jgi:hypothetical protein